MLAFMGDVVGTERDGGGDSAAEANERQRIWYVIGLLKQNAE
jgi:hypothetical protein